MGVDVRVGEGRALRGRPLKDVLWERYMVTAVVKGACEFCIV
jgi:hypothetical protein